MPKLTDKPSRLRDAKRDLNADDERGFAALTVSLTGLFSEFEARVEDTYKLGDIAVNFDMRFYKMNVSKTLV